MKTEHVSKICRLRLEKLSEDAENVTHKIIFRRRKGGIQLYIPMAGGEARRNHKEGKWCYWLTLTCPTDRIKRGDLVLDVKNQTTTHVRLDVTEEFLNIMNNDDNMEKVIGSRNDQHHKLQISDKDVERYVSRELTNRVETDYKVQSWEEECPTCLGTRRYPKYPQFTCKCKTGKVTKKIIQPLNEDGFADIKHHQNIFTRAEVIKKLHASLDATATDHEALRQVFVKQLDNWIDKNL